MNPQKNLADKIIKHFIAGLWMKHEPGSYQRL